MPVAALQLEDVAPYAAALAALLIGLWIGHSLPRDSKKSWVAIGSVVLRVALLGLAVLGIVLLYREGQDADPDSRDIYAQILALLIVGIGSVAIFTTGRRRRTATSDFSYMRSADKSFERGAAVPEEVAKREAHKKKVLHRYRAEKDFSYVVGSETKTVSAGSEVTEAVSLRSEAKDAVKEEWVAKESFTAAVSEPVEVSAGATVTEEVAKKDAAKGHVESQRGWSFRGLIVGKDNRWSTSKLQAVLWTGTVMFALISLLLADKLGFEEVDEKNKELTVDFPMLNLPDEYYLLLGGPFAAAILAKAFTAVKVENGQLVKPEAPEATRNPFQGLQEVVSDDSMKTDLVDMQYFFFNLLALAYFYIFFVVDLEAGLPEIPEPLFGLTSAAALAYVTKKAVERSAPLITSVVPQRAAAGTTVEVWGQYLAVDETSEPTVQVGNQKADVKLLRHERNGDHLEVKLPQLEPGKHNLVVVPVGGQPTPGFEIEIEGVTITSVEPDPVPDRPGVPVVIKGTGFGAEGKVLLAGEPLKTTGWTQTEIVGQLEKRLGPAGSDATTLQVHVGDELATKAVKVQGLSITEVAGPLELDLSARLVVTGTGLSDPALEVRLDGTRMRTGSQAETQLVARFDPDLFAKGRYKVASPATLLIKDSTEATAAGTVRVQTPE